MIELYKDSKLIMDNELRTSYSQIETFQQCPLKWYWQYFMGEMEPVKTEALDYGKAIHKMLEELIKSKFTLSKLDCLSIYYEELIKEEICFESKESADKCRKDTISYINHVYEAKELDVRDMNFFQKAFFLGESEVEVPFRLEYKLPVPVQYRYTIKRAEDTKTKIFDKVVIVGFIDQRIMYENMLIQVDHKTGTKKFWDNKLQTNLQFPVYSMASMRDEKKLLPSYCFYNFTRLKEQQAVQMNIHRIKTSVTIMDKAFSEMFTTNGVQPEGNPSKLCFWCEFSKHKNNTCPFSSDYKPE